MLKFNRENKILLERKMGLDYEGFVLLKPIADNYGIELYQVFNIFYIFVRSFDVCFNRLCFSYCLKVEFYLSTSVCYSGWILF